MASQTEHVLRLRRTDNKSAYTLVNVAKIGRKDLDIKLVGTDKDTLFATTVKETDIKSHQERNFAGDLEEWKTLLSFTLWNRRPEGSLPDFLQGVETVSAISGSTLTITFRKNIGGITQRLGSIKLKETDEEVNTLDWADAAAATSDELRNQLETLQASVDSQTDQIAKLTTELDMLVRAKKEHEGELLSKFAALLNAKKLKIRDQQRLLNGAKIDPKAAEEVSTARSSRTSRKAGPSRGSKRKANQAAPASTEAEDQDDVETVDGSDTADGESRRQHETPEPSDADGETETDDGDEGSPKKSPAAAASQASTQGRSQRAADEMDLDQVQEIPPRRELPFKPKPTAKASTPPPTSTAHEEDDEDDDETDDDEL